VDDEKFVDMSTSISGSGPAYIFMLMEAMIDAGVHMGFARDVATTLVYHTLLGSTLYAMETGEHPAILRNQVTSPAGTTASAIYELEKGKFRIVINDVSSAEDILRLQRIPRISWFAQYFPSFLSFQAVWACYRRSLELGGHVSSVGPGRQNIPERREIVHHHWASSDFPAGEMGQMSDSDDDEEPSKSK